MNFAEAKQIASFAIELHAEEVESDDEAIVHPRRCDAVVTFEEVEHAHRFAQWLEGRGGAAFLTWLVEEADADPL